MKANAKRQRKTASMEKILETAAAEFAEKGFAGARIDEIAELAGINKAMLYYHVGDKQELHSEVVLSVMRPALELLQGIVARPLPPEEKLRMLVRALARYASDHALMPRIMLHEIAAGGVHLPDEVIRCIAGVFGTVKQVLDDGVQAGVFRVADPLAAHFGIIASTMLYIAAEPIRQRAGAVLGFPLMAQQPVAENADHIVEMILHGVIIGKEGRQ